MWLRNLFFVGVILGGIGGIRAVLFPPPVPPHLEHFDAGAIEADDFRAVAAQVDAAIGTVSAQEGLKPAPPAAPLTIARRLHLALMGSIPSLQEIRQFESYQGEHRFQWW